MRSVKKNVLVITRAVGATVAAAALGLASPRPYPPRQPPTRARNTATRPPTRA
jgi:hypothetical protein